jgi:hypothetical protein
MNENLDKSGEEPDYLTIDEAIEHITGLVADALSSAAGVNAVIPATSIKAILDKVASKEALEIRGIQGDIVAELNRAPNGIHSTGIWTRLRSKPHLNNLPLEAVEEALADLKSKGIAYPDEGGALPVWKYGKAPAPAKTKK